MNYEEIQSQLSSASSGKGTKMLGTRDALDILTAGEEINLFLVSVEVYELRNELEIPRIDISLYNVCNEGKVYSLPLNKKKIACREAFNDMLKLIEDEQKLFGFRLWLED